MDWQLAFQFIAMIGVGSGTLAWLSRALAGHWMSKDIESYKQKLADDSSSKLELLKSELKSRSDKELEQLKADLRVAASQREATFARLQERRIGLVAELYQKLARADAALGSLMKPLQLVGEPAVAEKMKVAAEAANAFVDAYTANRIFFTQEICDALDDVARKHHNAWIDFTIWQPEWEAHDPDIAKQAFDARLKAWKTISEDVPVVRRAIERSMRALLGVVDPPPSASAAESLAS